MVLSKALSISNSASIKLVSTCLTTTLLFTGTGYADSLCQRTVTSKVARPHSRAEKVLRTVSVKVAAGLSCPKGYKFVGSIASFGQHHRNVVVPAASLGLANEGGGHIFQSALFQ